MSYFGGEDLPSDIADVTSGRKTVGDKLAEAAIATPEKLFQAASPIYKTAAELASGMTTFPDMLHPRPIRDKMEHAARLLSLDAIYRVISGKPRKGSVWEELRPKITYGTDPGEAAYHTSRALVYDWLSKNDRDKPPYIPDAKANALYYYKRAVQYKDERAAKKYLAQYRALGGKENNIPESLKRSSILGILSNNDKAAFMDSLDPKEREVVSRGEQWYMDTFYGETK
jgi:hypothetical protein